MAHQETLHPDKPCSHKGRNPGIDLGLAVIAAVNQPGVRWTSADIAEVCGCSLQAIQRYEWKALAKLRKAAARFL